MAMTVRKRLIQAGVLGLATLFFFSGYAMTASFAGAAANARPFEPVAWFWLGGTVLNLSATVLVLVLAWRARQS